MSFQCEQCGGLKRKRPKGDGNDCNCGGSSFAAPSLLDDDPQCSICGIKEMPWFWPDDHTCGRHGMMPDSDRLNCEVASKSQRRLKNVASQPGGNANSHKSSNDNVSDGGTGGVD